MHDPATFFSKLIKGHGQQKLSLSNMKELVKW